MLKLQQKYSEINNNSGISAECFVGVRNKTKRLFLSGIASNGRENHIQSYLERRGYTRPTAGVKDQHRLLSPAGVKDQHRRKCKKLKSVQLRNRALRVLVTMGVHVFGEREIRTLYSNYP
jgi:hypothetical protein